MGIERTLVVWDKRKQWPLPGSCRCVLEGLLLTDLTVPVSGRPPATTDPNRSSEQSRLRRAPTIGQAQPRDRYWRLLRCTLLHLERQHPPLPFAIDVRGGVTQQGSRMLLPGLGNHDLGGSENEC